MAIDWSWLEELLVKQAEKALEAFASEHKTETFYAAMFEVEPFDGVFVKLLLNTKEHIVAKVGENADKPHYKYMPASFKYTLPISKTIDQWNELDDAIVEATEEDMEEERTNSDGMWATTGKLVDTVCRAAFRLEKTGFAKLQRTPDFAIGVQPEQHEPGDMSVDRYKKFRSKLSLSVPAGR